MLKPFSKLDGCNAGFSVTVDKMNRVCLNTALMREFGLLDKIDLYLFWDAETHIIGISKECAVKNIVPFTFDKRGYTQAKDYIAYCGIDNTHERVKFYYEGMQEKIYLFRQGGRRTVRFKQNRNGNLERY